MEIGTLRPSKYQNALENDAYRHSVNPFTSGDSATITHECVHDVSSRLRKISGPQYNCFYILDGFGYKVKEIKTFKLKDVAQKIPPEYRGDIYQLYLVSQQKYWNDEPSYILDEWNAYTCGTAAALRDKDNVRAQDSGFRMLEMAIYAQYLKDMAKQNDITFFVDFLTTRNFAICEKLEMTNAKMIKNYKILKTIVKI
jgi:hypothetical protein